MQTVKIYDCSNSPERPTNRGFGGLVENAVVTILKKYGPLKGLFFVDSPEECDIIFTNDVYPESIQTNFKHKPKIKRMDGIFWQPELIERNLPYVHSCKMSDTVIFVSNFSYYCYTYEIQDSTTARVILNWVDEDIFYAKQNKKPKLENYVAVATSWARPEKGLAELLKIAKCLKKEETLYLVGTMPEDINLPDNVKSLGYMSDLRLANTLRDMDAMINTSQRDAAPKVVAEAISCGLPVFYLSSGGTEELTKLSCTHDTYYYRYNSYGIGYGYNGYDVSNSLNDFRHNHERLAYILTTRNRRTESLVEHYQRAFCEVNQRSTNVE
jgi:glycosyltransferase involved in cell wall biosynthesis